MWVDSGRLGVHFSPGPGPLRGPVPGAQSVQRAELFAAAVAASAIPGPLVLVTAFAPFGGSPVNPTVAIARALAAMPCRLGARAYTTLPVVTGTAPGSAWSAIEPLLESLRPDAVVALAAEHNIHFLPPPPGA